MIYFFSLGRTFALCFAELEALLKTSRVNYKIKHKTGSHVIIETKKEIDCEELLRASGGIIKIGKILTNTNQYYQILSNTNKLIKKEDLEKYKNFGISLIGFKENIQKICEEFKSHLNLHYILPKEGTELSSSQISKGTTLEITIVKNEEEYQIFQTTAVQNIDLWTKKDVSRPFIDDKLGMLPLKVARMMVNLAVGTVEEGTGNIAEMTILDPFCGMGSILQEAIDLGIKNVIGGDINEDVLKKCEENLQWFIKTFSLENVKIEMINSDAAKIDEELHEKVDLIVTEPFLGDARKIKRIYESTNIRIQNNPPKNAAIEIKKILKGLEKMYLGSLKSWKSVLDNNGVICIIVPEIEVGNQTFTIPFVEIVRKTGYNIISSYEYSREQAIVKRKIYLLKLN